MKYIIGTFLLILSFYTESILAKENLIERLESGFYIEKVIVADDELNELASASRKNPPTLFFKSKMVYIDKEIIFI